MSDIGLSNSAPVRVNQTCSVNEWSRYVLGDPLANIYHLPEWSQVLEESLGYKPFHLFAWNQEGKLCGILPLFLVSSALTGNRLVSLPFSYICGPLTDSSQTLSSLIQQAERLCDSVKCRYLEIRSRTGDALPNGNSLWAQNRLVISHQFSTFILNLSQPEIVWKMLDPKSVRWAVGKARKDGVLVRKGDSIQDIKIFYRLNLQTKRRIGVPGHPEKLFQSMFDKLHDRCTLYLAYWQKEIIAGIVTLKFNNTMLYGYGASDDAYRAHQPNSLLVWTAIEEACREGYQYFDFGRTSPAEQNVTSFKKHWGTEEKALSYGYYPNVPDSMALNGAGMRYRLATGLWKRMPLPLAQFCSNKLFHHLG